MDPFQTGAALLTLAALLAYLNYRWLKLPPTIGLMALTLVFSLVLIGAARLFPAVAQEIVTDVRRIDFDRTLLHGMLGFLLFAGAMHLDLNDLASRKLVIGTLATVGVLASTFLIGGLAWCLLPLLGVEMRFLSCLLLGALLSPTDPIAVLGILKNVGVPKDLAIIITGESLFNDGVGVVVFLTLLQLTTGGQAAGPGSVLLLLLKEVVGGAAFGLLLGLLVYLMLRSVDNYKLEVGLTLAVTAGGYALAEALHVSAPIAVIVIGLLIGNPGRAFAMSPQTVERLDQFWELLDEVLNAILFVLLGLELLVVSFTGPYLAAGALGILIVLFARFCSVGAPLWVLRRWQRFDRRAVGILTWGGLRGGISVALALSLAGRGGTADVPEREVILAITYVVVVFSILFQGLTMGPLLRRWLATPGLDSIASAPADHPRQPPR